MPQKNTEKLTCQHDRQLDQIKMNTHTQRPAAVEKSAQVALIMKILAITIGVLLVFIESKYGQGASRHASGCSLYKTTDNLPITNKQLP